MVAPWRLANIQHLPAVDAPSERRSGTQIAGPEGINGALDTPIDPRFPTFLATNLPEALPGPFSPSSSSVTVRGLRAGRCVHRRAVAAQRDYSARNRHAYSRGIRPPTVWGASRRGMLWQKPCRS